MYIFLCFFLLVKILAAAWAEEDCPKFCNYNYSPVCGGVEGDSSNDITHGNACALKVYACTEKISSTILIIHYIP